MMFVPNHPAEIIAEALNRYGADLSTPEVRDQIRQFIVDCLSSLEQRGHLARVPWCVAVSASPLGDLEFLVIPHSLRNRVTRYTQRGDTHLITDVDTAVTTEAANLLVGLTQHAEAVEKYLNAHYRN